MNDTQEHRAFWRAPFHATVQLADATGVWEGELLDICLKGALLNMSDDWPGVLGAKCRLRLDLGEDVTIMMQTTVAHLESTKVGLRCDNIGLDSITHLRSLVTLNAGDPDLLERELSALLHGGAPVISGV
ncbi:MAG: PilZ domain-containing protein [Betaproteobacteria bacterium]|nr:PilZ domain-containing protein [Betaproteobacteria bacterium]